GERAGGSGGAGRAIRGDIEDADDCDAMVEDAVRQLGGLDHLVVAAGISDYHTVEETDAATWQRLVATNVVGPALVTRAALPHLRAGAGRVVFMSSIAARRAPPGLVPYSVTKSALEALAAG